MKTLKKITLLFTILLLLFSCQNGISLNNNEWKKSEVKNKIILALWDSLTAWYSLDLEESYPNQLEKILNINWYNYEVINAWVSWDTSSQLLNRIDLYISEDNNLPDIAIVVIGWNDWLRWKGIEELQSNIEKIISKLKEKNIKVVIGWMKVPPNLWLNYSNNFFNIYKKISKNTDSYLIDFFLEWVAWNSNLNLGDSIHPNKKWYEIIASNVFEFLKSNKLIKDD